MLDQIGRIAVFERDSCEGMKIFSNIFMIKIIYCMRCHYHVWNIMYSWFIFKSNKALKSFFFFLNNSVDVPSAGQSFFELELMKNDLKTKVTQKTCIVQVG